MSHRFPLRVTPQQWDDIREHYEEDDWTEAPPDEIDFPDDHDRRFSDYYDTREGDIGEEVDGE